MRLYLLLCLGSVLSAASIHVELDQNSAAPGDTVGMSLQLTNAPQSHAWGYVLYFDTQVLELLSMGPGTVGTFVEDSRGLGAINNGGEIRMGGYHLGRLPANTSGSLAELSFRIRSGASGTTRLDLTPFASNDQFGAIMYQQSDEHIPNLQDALLDIAGAIGRSIWIGLIRDGVDVPFDASISPADDLGVHEAGEIRFNGLTPTTNYLVQLIDPSADG